MPLPLNVSFRRTRWFTGFSANTYSAGQPLATIASAGSLVPVAVLRVIVEALVLMAVIQSLPGMPVPLIPSPIMRLAVLATVSVVAPVAKAEIVVVAGWYVPVATRLQLVMVKPETGAFGAPPPVRYVRMDEPALSWRPVTVTFGVLAETPMMWGQL